MNERIILFGGTFDPIHNGHIKVAESAIKLLRGDMLVFIPAKRSPHKKEQPGAGKSQRYEMIKLSIENHPEFKISDCEFYRNEPSYTLDTVRHFKKIFGNNAELFWLVGADTVKDLCHWYKIEELVDECRLTIMRRGGVETPDFSEIEKTIGPERASKLKSDMIPTPLIDISSTEIRRKISNGGSCLESLTPKVADFIKKNGIYLH